VKTINPARARARLRQLASNLWWSWSWEAIDLFRGIDQKLWRECNHNLIVFLDRLTDETLETALAETPLATRISYLFHRFEELLHPEMSYGELHAGLLRRRPVAYFCMEFGIHESLPIYSGGLGVLAGDHLKSASDLGVPLVGVGLLYTGGYFTQEVPADGWQQERYQSLDLATTPLQLVKAADGQEMHVPVEIGADIVQLRIWRADVGRIPLYLLDANHDANHEDHRELTRHLYGGDLAMRIRQEVILGVGGYRALRSLGIHPGVVHLNEGHSAFAILEYARTRMERLGESFQQALTHVRNRTVFTTHTPVPAGHDRFPPDLFLETLSGLKQRLQVSDRDLLATGRVRPDDQGEPFCMTVLGLRNARRCNAVSARNGEVCRRMWQELYGSCSTCGAGIGHVTNGVHVRSWVAPGMQRLYARKLGDVWKTKLSSDQFWRQIEKVSDAELWEEHQMLRHALVRFIRRRVAANVLRPRGSANGGRPESLLNPEALTIGWARRFATYKRSTLLFTDLDRLAAILNDPQRPVQLVFAGKAHPRDEPGKRMLQKILAHAREPRFLGKIAFVENYDISVGRHLVQGVDLWLNTPLAPREASGTSGQKVLLNGGLNCSIADGWWREASDGLNGFTIGDGETHTDPDIQWQRDADSLYRVLEDEVLPAFYDRDDRGVPLGWMRRMKHAIRSLAWRFSSDRMVKDYLHHAYIPTAGGGSADLSGCG